jgi:diaminopimelate epimerase
VVASALITHRVLRLALPLCVKVRGGDVLTVDAREEGDAFRDVTLTGPATEVFSGEIRL